MNWIKIACLIIIFFYALIFSFLCLKTKRFMFSILINALLGIFLMTTINLTSKYSGVKIPVNEFSLSISSFLGVPGIILILLINLIFL